MLRVVRVIGWILFILGAIAASAFILLVAGIVIGAVIGTRAYNAGDQSTADLCKLIVWVLLHILAVPIVPGGLCLLGALTAFLVQRRLARRLNPTHAFPVESRPSS